MSSKTSGKKFHTNDVMLELELSEVFISFKELLSHVEAKDVYSGKEERPFREKHIEFQQIMLSEFID